MPSSVVFWQKMLTPHMTELALHVSRLGKNVYFFAQADMSEDRAAMGWSVRDTDGLRVRKFSTKRDVDALFNSVENNAVHITQGVRSNGLIGYAQKRISQKGFRHYPVMEGVDLRSNFAVAKSIIYTWKFWRMADKIEGILSIGEKTADWIRRRAPSSVSVVPFAYFLRPITSQSNSSANTKFRFLFVGNLIPRKRVDMIFDSLAELSEYDFEIEIVGDGPERENLEKRATGLLSGRVTFLGSVSMDQANIRISKADCLILPSDHDGWGAVISEAQILGTPVVCSTACGAHGTVRASGHGAVFETGKLSDLKRHLLERLHSGPVSIKDRGALSEWGSALTAPTGAKYLINSLEARYRNDCLPRLPWAL